MLCLLPEVASAAVTINEIAWMGNKDSANDEWIELYNNGAEAVDLEGWVLEDQKGLNINLTGSIGAGEYVVLERTDDDSAPGPAFLIYTGALANTGATLVLKRSDGGVEDQVSGGENWQAIGGDNVTKETAQYTTSGWITAAPTPGAANHSVSSTPTSATETGVKTTKTTTAEKQSEAILTKTEGDLKLKLKIPNMIYVDQAVTFSVKPSGIDSQLLRTVRHYWNFGDMNTAEGKTVEHSYLYAGEYIVTLYSRKNGYEQVARKNIKVLPVAFRLSRTSEGDIMLRNSAKYEVDISGYRLVSTGTFTFPDYTIVLPGATITIPKWKVGAHSLAGVILRDEQGKVVANIHDYKAEPKAEASPGITSPREVSQTPTHYVFADESNFSDDGVDQTLDNDAKDKVEGTNRNDQTANVYASQTKIPRENWPYLGLLGVIVLGLFGVLLGRSKEL